MDADGYLRHFGSPSAFARLAYNAIMAAKGQPGKSTKMVWRTCLKCTTRLSELCYDTHTFCETCRGKVCDFNSFCEECDSWTKDFRKMYMRHQRTLYLKRVSKSNVKSKAKSPSVVDDNASPTSMESRVSPPMVILPLDPHLVDTEMNLAELGNIQTVDSVVEVQYQPMSPPPPPSTAVFDASLMNSAFAKLNEMLDEFRGSRPPLREHVGSDRRSPSAGPSDIARPNPIAKVSDTAPQGPDAAPGPSTATHVPPALGLSRLDDPSDGEFVSPRGGVDQGEHVRSWSRHVSPTRTHTHQERLREDLERTHAEISQLRDYNDYCRARGRAPPDHYYRDLDILHSRYDQLSLALAESHQAIASGRSGRSPVIASTSDAPRPHRPDSSSIKGPRLSPWPGPSSPDRRRPRGASSDLSHHSRRSEERYHDRFATSAEPRHSRRPRSRGSPSPKRMGFASPGSPSPERMGFASKGSPSPKRMGFASRASPSPKRMGFASRGSPSPKRMGFASRDSPSPKRQRFASRDSSSPRRQHSSRATSREDSYERPPSRSSPTRPSSPSREYKEAEESSMPAPVRAMIDFILKSFPEATASPSRPSSRSFDLSASAGVTDAATPSGSLLAWCHAMSDAFSDTQERFTHRIKDGRVCHTLLPTLNKFERVSNSPTQGKELKANPDVLDLLRNSVPDNRHVPISIKEAVAVERSLRSGLESHNFLTWSVMALIRSLHEKKLLPRDNPVISQLQKSFSKACSNVASCMTSNTVFVTMKRRQLLLSHVVPSVSDAQKRNLLWDPFFQTSSLFAASSVEAARSAARDLSLFKPHLKASSSTFQSRRQPYSSSSAQRGPARPSSRPPSSQRSSSPFRQQSSRKGDLRFQKKSSGTPQKRGGFRK